MELVQEYGPEMELIRLNQLKKDVVVAKLAKDATVKVKVEADKLVKEAMAAQAKFVTDRQKAKDELIDAKVSSEAAVGERDMLMEEVTALKKERVKARLVVL